MYSPITTVWNETTGLTWSGSTEDDKKRYFDVYESDADFVRTTGTHLIASRDIDLKTYPTEKYWAPPYRVSQPLWPAISSSWS